MSFSETVTTKDGFQKTVFADSKEDLADAVKVAKGETQPVYPNINKPVQKGHDKVDVQGDLSVKLKDGTGAHNSPRDAVRDDGKAEGAWKGDEEPEFAVVEDASANDVVDGQAQESDVPPQARDAEGEKTTDGRKGSNKAPASK